MGKIITATAATTTQVGEGACRQGAGVIVVLDVTAGAALSLTLSIKGKDTASDKYWNILSSVVVAGVGTTIYKVYPGITPVANQAVADLIPDIFQVEVVHGNATAATYTVGFSPIP